MDFTDINNSIMSIKDIANRYGRDIINGKFEGGVKEYYDTGELKYEGLIENGKYYRYVKYNTSNNWLRYIIYTGSFKDGEYDGYGKEYYYYGDEYQNDLKIQSFYRSFSAGLIDEDDITDEGWKVLYDYEIDNQYVDVKDIDYNILKKYNISYIRPGFSDEGRLKYDGNYKHGLFNGYGELYIIKKVS